MKNTSWHLWDWSRLVAQKQGPCVFFQVIQSTFKTLTHLRHSTTFYDLIQWLINISLPCIQFCWQFSKCTIVAGGAGAYDVAKKDDHLSTPGAPTKGPISCGCREGIAWFSAMEFISSGHLTSLTRRNDNKKQDYMIWYHKIYCLYILYQVHVTICCQCSLTIHSQCHSTDSV